MPVTAAETIFIVVVGSRQPVGSRVSSKCPRRSLATVRISKHLECAFCC
jgi:hypothetical protein